MNILKSKGASLTECATLLGVTCASLIRLEKMPFEENKVINEYTLPTYRRFKAVKESGEMTIFCTYLELKERYQKKRRGHEGKKARARSEEETKDGEMRQV